MSPPSRFSMPTQLLFGRYTYPLQGEGARPRVMGILNVTPDSFSDGGQYQSLEFAISHAEQMLLEGVDIIDVGGESSRPGAPALPLEQELDRVMPVLYALRDCGAAISIDTYKPQLMREAIIAGVDMINDINGFRAPGAIDAVRDSDCALCIMHMQSTPDSMQLRPDYSDVVAEVIAFLRERVEALTAAGIDPRRLCIRSEEHTSELQSHRDLHSFPTRRSSDLAAPRLQRRGGRGDRLPARARRGIDGGRH